MNKRTEPEVMDGRRLRSERSKQAILQACEELLREGHLVPTAQMISDKANLPIRSFFRHFPDMETLFNAMDDSLKPRYQRIYEKSQPEGSLSARIAGAVKLHAQSYEENKAIFQSTKAQLWRYPALRDNYGKVCRRLRKDLDKRIPELRDIDADTREVIDGLASFEMWARLRDQQKLSCARSMRIIRQSIESLLCCD